MYSGAEVVMTTLVGSRANGLARPDSDYDYRSVYLLPTEAAVRSELVGGPTKPSWTKQEGDDYTAYEVGHFLKLALKGNPAIIEVFKGPKEFLSPVGEEMMYLFPYTWSSEAIYTAHTGYSRNQVRKFLDDPLGHRASKYAIASLRGLMVGAQLLREGDCSLEIPAEWLSLFQNMPADINKGVMTAGRVFDLVEDWLIRIKNAYDSNPDKQAEPEKLIEWLVRLRREG